jgi:kynurenine formamidase
MGLPQDLLDLAARCSNWGRWGPDDERGTLNFVTPAAVLRGAAAVKRGESFLLSIPYDEGGPLTGRVPGRHNPVHTMLCAGVSYTGDTSDFTTSDDNVDMGTQAATHWDALAHVGYDDRLYNDVPMSAVTMEHGASRLGIDRFGSLVTRGILCDIARLKGVEHFDEPYAITGDDLAACADSASLTVESGDVIVVHTGQMHWLDVGDRHRYADITPGVGTGAIEWLHDMEVAAIATDTHVFEPYPVDDPAAFLAVHMIDLRDLGLVQGQQWKLDELAADCARDGVYEFLLAATPLPITGGVGGPVAPTATK